MGARRHRSRRQRGRRRTRGRAPGRSTSSTSPDQSIVDFQNTGLERITGCVAEITAQVFVGMGIDQRLTERLLEEPIAKEGT
jgi:hypothetical protein